MSYQSHLDKLMQMATIEQLNLLMRQFNMNTTNTNTNSTISKDSIATNTEILSLPIVQKVVLAYEKELQEIKDKEQKNKCNSCCNCGVTNQSDNNNTSIQKNVEVSKVIEDLRESCNQSFLNLETRLNELTQCVNKLMSLNNEYKSFVVVDVGVGVDVDVDVEPEIKIEKVDKVETIKPNNILPIITETEHIKLEIHEKIIPSEVEELVKEPITPTIVDLLSNIDVVNDKVIEDEILNEEEEEVSEDDVDVESEEEVATDVSEEDIKESNVVKEEVDEEEVVEEEEEVVEEEEEVVEEEDVVEEVEKSKKDEVVVEEEEEVVEDDEEVFEIEIDDVTYYATDEENGILYEVTKTGDVGKKVGIIKDGEPIFS